MLGDRFDTVAQRRAGGFDRGEDTDLDCCVRPLGGDRPLVEGLKLESEPLEVIHIDLDSEVEWQPLSKTIGNERDELAYVLRAYGKTDHVFFDLKSRFDADQSDLRL